MHSSLRVVSLALLILGVIATSLTLMGCSSHPGADADPGDDQSGRGGKIVNIYLLPQKNGPSSFKATHAGAEEAAKDLKDVDLVEDDQADGSSGKASSLINAWALRGADVIAVSSNDPDAIAPAMKAARAQGVHLLTWGTDAPKDSREFFTAPATPRQIGDALVDSLVEDLGDVQPVGNIAVIADTSATGDQSEWITAILARLTKSPGLHLVAVKSCDEDQAKASQAARDVMRSYPDLKGIIGISSEGLPGVADAVKKADKAGRIMVTGLSTTDNIKSYVLDGTVQSMVLWNTRDLGYLTVCAAEAVATGKLKPGATSFTAGRLGAKKVVGDTILSGDLAVVTQANIAGTEIPHL